MQRSVLVFFTVIYLALSLYVMAIFIPASGYGYNGGWATHRYGQAMHPLIYRVLVPGIANTMAVLPSENAKQCITHLFIRMRDSDMGQYVLHIKNKRFPMLNDGNPLMSDDYIYGTGIQMVVCYLFLLAFIGMLYRLAATIFKDRPIALLAPIVALLWLPAFIYSYAYTYDFAELFFCCACLYLLATHRFAAYLLWFALATLNKETTIFLTVFFAIYYFHRMPRAQYIMLLLWQLWIYLAIKIVLAIHFMEVFGLLFGNFFWWNISRLQHMDELCYAFLLSLLWLILFAWRKTPVFLRYGVWMIAANSMAYVVACYPGEYRSFYGSFPVLVMFITHAFVEIARHGRHMSLRL